MKMKKEILKRVREIEAKRGIEYAKTDGNLFKTMRRAYSFVFFYSLVINLIFILSVADLSGTEWFKSNSSSFVTVIVCTAVMTVGYILLFTKTKIPFFVLSVFSQITLISVLAKLSKDRLGLWGYSKTFYFRHFIPLSLAVIIAAALTFIAVRERIKTEKLYKKVLEDLYKNINNNGQEIGSLTDEQWEEFLKDYNSKDFNLILQSKNKTKNNKTID